MGREGSWTEPSKNARAQGKAATMESAETRRQKVRARECANARRRECTKARMREDAKARGGGERKKSEDRILAYFKEC